ncbi:phenylalanine--tRNA ligase subunit alpha [[Eubacterium] cellulosolvens]
MGSEIDKIMDELSYNETKVILALKDVPMATPEQLVQKGGFRELVEVMNAISWLQSKQLVYVAEEVTKLYSLAKKQYATKALPERRVLKLLKKYDGILSVSELEKTKKLSKPEIPLALGWLKRKGWATIVKREGETILEITERGRETLDKPGPDEKLLEKLARGELKSDEVEKKAVENLKARKEILKERTVITRQVTLTDLGKELVDRGLKLKERVTQITPELLQSGKWKDVEFRKYDVNTFAPAVFGGRPHPLQQIISEIRTIFVEMGFSEIHYDFVQSTFWVMDALFTAQDHPVRDIQDTFYLSKPDKLELPEDDLVKRVKDMHEHGGDTESDGWQYTWNPEKAKKAILRTHTTVNTIRHLAEHPEPPVKVFSIERNFRNETLDSTHLPEFYQIEGIVMEEGASFPMLIGVLKEFYHRMGFPKVKVRPAYYPYTEPSMDVIVWFNDTWLELGGSGIFRPEVTEPLGVKHPVLAWGLGLERLAMLRLGLKDIRDLYISDIDWLRKVPMI